MTNFSNNGISYDIQISGGVLQTRLTGSSTWDSHTQMVGLQSAYVALSPGATEPYVTALTSNGIYYSTPLGDLITRYASSLANYDEAAALGVLVSGSTAPTSNSPLQTFETPVSLAGNQIVDVAPGVLPSDVVVVSQLSALSQALTTVINAGDSALQADIDALELTIATLPAGLQMSTVQAAINASVAEAVLNEIIDDAQRQAIVDAVLDQLSTIDTAVIGRVGVAEALLAALEPRVVGLEANDVAQNAKIAALESKDLAQDTAIAAAAAAAQSAITSNVAQETRLGNIEVAAASANQAATPVEVQIRAGVVTSAVGVALGDVTIDNSNATHMTVSINLGSSNAGKRRVDQGFRVMSNGAEEKLGHAPTRLGEVYSFTFLKERAGSTAVNLLLN